MFNYFNFKQKQAQSLLSQTLFGIVNLYLNFYQIKRQKNYPVPFRVYTKIVNYHFFLSMLIPSFEGALEAKNL